MRHGISSSDARTTTPSRSRRAARRLRRSTDLRQRTIMEGLVGAVTAAAFRHARHAAVGSAGVRAWSPFGGGPAWGSLSRHCDGLQWVRSRRQSCDITNLPLDVVDRNSGLTRYRRWQLAGPGSGVARQPALQPRKQRDGRGSRRCSLTASQNALEKSKLAFAISGAVHVSLPGY